MDIKQLQYFVKIVEYENMSRASEELLVAQPALSRMIKNMEERLQTKLFERNGKKIKLSRSGEIFYSHAVVILKEFEEAQKEIDELNSREKNDVIVVMKTAIGLLPMLLKAFYQRFPDINVTVLREVDEKRENQNIDFIIEQDFSDVPKKDKIVLMHDDCKIMISQKHPLAAKQGLSLGDLREEKFYVLNDSPSLHQITEKACLDAGFSPDIYEECNSRETILSFVEAGLGAAMIPYKTWFCCWHPDLIAIDYDLSKYKRIISLYEVSGSRNKKVRAFEEFCIEFFGQVDQTEGNVELLKKHFDTL